MRHCLERNCRVTITSTPNNWGLKTPTDEFPVISSVTLLESPAESVLSPVTKDTPPPVTLVTSSPSPAESVLSPVAKDTPPPVTLVTSSPSPAESVLSPVTKDTPPPVTLVTSSPSPAESVLSPVAKDTPPPVTLVTSSPSPAESVLSPVTKDTPPPVTLVKSSPSPAESVLSPVAKDTPPPVTLVTSSPVASPSDGLSPKLWAGSENIELKWRIAQLSDARLLQCTDKLFLEAELSNTRKEGWTLVKRKSNKSHILTRYQPQITIPQVVFRLPISSSVNQLQPNNRPKIIQENNEKRKQLRFSTVHIEGETCVDLSTRVSGTCRPRAKLLAVTAGRSSPSASSSANLFTNHTNHGMQLRFTRQEAAGRSCGGSPQSLRSVYCRTSPASAQDCSACDRPSSPPVSRTSQPTSPLSTVLTRTLPYDSFAEAIKSGCKTINDYSPINNKTAF
ncbi:hypothetical protein J6590_013748 [Homalodisca vitripennis]|nr:hypothetical protein J6590_013748 [Homalodisca vitripennis]